VSAPPAIQGSVAAIGGPEELHRRLGALREHVAKANAGAA